MVTLGDILDLDELDALATAGYVRRGAHPTDPLWIYNYTTACQYDRAWSDTSRACRGLIVRHDTMELVARPWPKFHNYGEHEDGALDLHAPCWVTDKMDGSLGILYPLDDGTHAIATRGSFQSEQAIHATSVWRSRYAMNFTPPVGLTYLFEIVFPENRVVLDYGDTDDLILLDVLDTDTGETSEGWGLWPGPKVEVMHAVSLAEALALPPRQNAEGVVVTYQGGLKVKIKQDDYVTLHRIMTHMNARNVWEHAAVHACDHLIDDPKHWGSFLGIDPDRAEECLALDADWLSGVPDEFYEWIQEVSDVAAARAALSFLEASSLATAAFEHSHDRSARYQFIRSANTLFTTQIMRLATASGEQQQTAASGALLMRCWREACPDATAPFARSEDVA